MQAALAECAQKYMPVNHGPKAFASRVKTPLAIAHRGYSAEYPENTLPAFLAAVESGADMVELDVQLTRDKRLAVIHDHKLDRTTDGSGRVRDYSLGELYQLDAGAWFSSDFAGARVPGLEGVLRLLDGRCLVNIELKPPHGASYSERSAISCAALGMVRSRGLMDSTIFTSFDFGLLRLIRRLEPGATLGVLTEEATDLDARDLVFEIDAASFNPRACTLTPQVVQVMHSADTLVMCWAGKDENTPEQMRRVLEMGADGFFADDVNLLRDEINKLQIS